LAAEAGTGVDLHDLEAIGVEDAPGVGLGEAGSGIGDIAGLERLDGLKLLFALRFGEVAQIRQERLQREKPSKLGLLGIVTLSEETLYQTFGVDAK